VRYTTRHEIERERELSSAPAYTGAVNKGACVRKKTIQRKQPQITSELFVNETSSPIVMRRRGEGGDNGVKVNY